MDKRRPVRSEKSEWGRKLAAMPTVRARRGPAGGFKQAPLKLKQEYEANTHLLRAGDCTLNRATKRGFARFRSRAPQAPQAPWPGARGPGPGQAWGSLGGGISIL